MDSCYLFDFYESGVNSFKYSFLTASGSEYFISFDIASYLFHQDCLICNNIYSISFYHEGSNSGYDENIRNTIIKIIFDFINEKNCPVLFICDMTDGLAESRLRLFTRCFNLFSDGFLFDSRLLQFEQFILPVGLFGKESDPNINHYLEQMEFEFLF